MERFDVILVGGGPATRILNKYLHMADPEIRTAVFRDEERIVNHCGTPYIVEGLIPWEKGLIREELVTRFGTPIIKDPVVGGDPAEKWVETASGKRYRYDRLVFATGSDQVVPDLPGKDLENVLKVRRTEDVKETMARLAETRRVVVLGGGFIGLEFAVSLRNLGKEVTVVEMAPAVLGGRYDEGFTAMIEDHLAGLGIGVMTGRRAEAFVGTDGRVSAVRLDGGEEIPADAVLSAVGVRPLVDYAESMGLAVTRNGIVVNEYFETNLPDVYAIGDCVETRSFLTGAPIPGKLGSHAGQMARILALNLTGRRTPFRGVINPVVSRFHGLSFAATGLTERDAVAAGFQVLTGIGESTSVYANMPDAKPVQVKVTYRADELRLIGVEMIGAFNPAGFIEAATHLIERGADLFDVIGSNYSSHPELTPKTSHPFLVWASEPVLRQVWKQARG